MTPFGPGPIVPTPANIGVFTPGGPPAQLNGTHAARPLATVVPDGSTYNEKDTGQEYQTIGGVWTLQHSPSVIGASSQSLGNIGAALTIDVQSQSGQIFRVVANTTSGTVTFANVVAGAQWIVQHTQDVTGGRRTIFSGVTWLAGAGAVTPAANSVDVFNFYSPDGAAIYGFQATSPIYGQPQPMQTTGAFEVPVGRLLCQSTGTATSGSVQYTHFTPDHDVTFSNLETCCTGLPTGLTLGRMAVCLYNGGNSYTTMARSASDATAWNATGYYTKVVVDDGQSNTISQATCKAGLTYAFAWIAVFTTTSPTLLAASITNQSSAADSSKLVRLAANHSGQSDIGASDAAVSGATGRAFWAALY